MSGISRPTAMAGEEDVAYALSRPASPQEIEQQRANAASYTPGPRQAMTIKPSETTRSFATGAVRGEDVGRGKPSLLPWGAIAALRPFFGGYAYMPWGALIEVSRIFEVGSKKYPPRNWEKGIPTAAFVDSASRHWGKFINGLVDEPHCAQWVWNVLCMFQTELWIINKTLPESVNDLHGLVLQGADLLEDQKILEPPKFMSALGDCAWGQLTSHYELGGVQRLARGVAYSLLVLDLYVAIRENRAGRDLCDLPKVQYFG